MLVQTKIHWSIRRSSIFVRPVLDRDVRAADRVTCVPKAHWMTARRLWQASRMRRVIDESADRTCDARCFSSTFADMNTKGNRLRRADAYSSTNGRTSEKTHVYRARHSSVTVLCSDEICDVLFRVGSKKFNYSELSEQIALKTGGLNVSTHIDESPHRASEYEEVRCRAFFGANRGTLFLFFRVFFCRRFVSIEMSRACSIFGKMFCCISREQTIRCLSSGIRLGIDLKSRQQLHQGDRLRTLIKGQASDYANSVHESGHTFAVMHSASQYGAVDQMSENLFGLTQVNRMQEIARLEDFDDIAKKLGHIAEHVLKKTSLRSVDGSSYARTTFQCDAFLQFVVQWRIERIVKWCQATGNLSRSSSGFIGRPIQSQFDSFC